jgi:hypothetical protein
VTAHARVLLCFEMQPDSSIQQVADDLQMSYRWTVDATSDLIAAGFLQRDRHGRSFSYRVSCPNDGDVSDARAVDVQRLSHALAVGSQRDPRASEAGLERRLEELQHELLVETAHLQAVRAEVRQIESTIERVRSLLRHPTLRVG